MALLTRNTLKNFFKSGSAPTEVNFSDLIDSTVNKVDDGFAKNQNDGLLLAPQGNSRRVLSFFENIKNKTPSFLISFSEDSLTKGISFKDSKNRDCMFLRDGGNVGIGISRPRYALEVNGFSASRGRVGTYLQGTAPADGHWHTIIDDLDDCQIFEIVARAAGRRGRGKYAMAHAIAISTFGKSSSSIRKTSAHFGGFWHRLQFRWRGDIHNYRLQMRTRSHYGLDDQELPYMIQYHIANLWDYGHPTVNNTNTGSYTYTSNDVNTNPQEQYSPPPSKPAESAEEGELTADSFDF